jgi:Flp pilus assembly protein TadG
MNQHNKSFLRRAHEDQSGQVMGMLWVMMFLLFAFAALVVDFGRLYFSFRELQTSTDAAALAGAQALPTAATGAAAEATALLYSGVAGNKNAYPNLPGVAMTYTPKCLTTLTNEGIACAESPAGYNAFQVTQTVSVPLIFAGILGARPVTLSATSTAAMRGANPVPYNVAIVVDSTQSMNSADKGGNCPGSRESCTLSGVQTLLQTLSPCGATQSSCGTVTANSSGGGGQVSSPVDQVTLLTFPAVTTASASADYACPNGTPTIEPYPLPIGPGYTSYSNEAAGITYQIVNFSSDYRTCDATTCGLSGSSDIVIAAGGNSSCKGLQAIGGQGTYYAGVIYSAESILLAQQAKNTNTENALILISDGEAQASCTTIVKNVCTKGPMVGASTNSGVYPSTVQQCHQAVTAAQWAAQQNAAGATVKGTKVYAVGYGAESSGCTTDTNPSITPCRTMQQIASDPDYFYTDYTSTTNGCVSASHSAATINQIFSEIAMTFTVARLIPNNTP